VKAVTGNK